MDNDVTPVYLAAQEGHLEVLKFLVLEAGGSLYVRAKDGMAPIHAASQMGCLNCVKWMIQDQGVDPNLRDGDGATPLHFAASRGHLDTVRWLLKHGARLSLDKFGKSPINDAAENQQVEGNSVASDCSNCKPKSISSNNTMKHNNSEPFYLHPPLSDRSMEPAHAPENGLYINPMSKHRHSVSSGNGESFYLHNPQEVIYNRVKDLFESTQRQQGLSALTVKVEVHSSSSGAGSDENLSSSDMSERSGDHEHDYEDIYMIREENKALERNKNRSRSRDSGSHSRSGSVTSSNSGGHVVVHLTTDNNNNDHRGAIGKAEEIYQKESGKEKIVANESGLSSGTSPLSSEDEPEKVKLGPRHSLPPKTNNATSNTKILKRVTSVPLETSVPPPPPPPPNAMRFDPDDEPRGAEIVEVVEEPTLKPSDILKGMCRSMSALYLTIVSLDGDEADKHGPNLVNKQRVLPFIPPSFPGSANSNNLIKPSEYLRSISDKRSSISSVRSLSESEDTENKFEEKRDIARIAPGPPPPPLPDLNLKEVPEKDNTGNIIPAWKRQMLAKKAAEKARKELEEQLWREAEEKRLQAIPQWKRQLLQKKEEAEYKIRSTLYTPKVVDEPKIKIQDTEIISRSPELKDENENEEHFYNDDSIKLENEPIEGEEQSDEEPANIIPWRAHLRKTNSKLNLLE
ncbi:unnamed protein product [Diabrotica balteata]|uniref:Espin n=1 Tax=Diabrotica balteata TaxID=107213 RepID=A0A9N9SPS9_DIABA|nr:unnamed protein product [Diabrotica balteata]